MTYGFEIVKDGIFKRTYTVYDLANNSISFKAEIIGTFKPKIIVFTYEGVEELQCTKIGGWRENWKVSKKGLVISEFKQGGGLCSGEYILRTGYQTYLAPRTIGSFFEFQDDIGKIKFSVNRRSFSGKCIIEVSESFEPLVAISVGLILNLIIEQQAAVVVSTAAIGSV